MKDKLLNKLAQQEQGFLTSTFLSPVLRGRPIRVRIGGVVLTLWTKQDYEGWGVFRPKGFGGTAKFVREATLQERQEYLKLFSAIRLVLCRRTPDGWLGITAHQNDPRLRVTGLVPVALVEEVQMFDTVVVRWDGQVCWFDSPANSNLAIASALREAYQNRVLVEKLIHPGVTQEERDAYVISVSQALLADEEAKKDQQEERIKETLYRAGAKYSGYLERGDVFTISYVVGGEAHTSTVRKSDLQVVSAGICLSNTDSKFDLQSLVSVLREGQRRGKILRVGENRVEQDYDDNSWDE